MQCIFASAILLSCDGGSEGDEPGITPPDPGGIVKIPLYFEDKNWVSTADYEAVKIGEYLWMNSNFNHYYKNATYTITREQINKVLQRYRIDPMDYQISIEDFNKYYGLYYSSQEIFQMSRDGVMYEGENRVLKRIKSADGDSVCAWKIPTAEDFRQLFAMCGNAQEADVRIALACKAGDNPAAISLDKEYWTYWFGRYNTNKYGFNMMPGGARFHNPTDWSFCFGENDCVWYNCAKGDLYNFFMTARWAAADNRTITIHDWVETREGKLYHWLNVRWCRKLTDEELGYKLYINTAKTDIKKLGLKENPPTGYTELANGYLRGFYVQYILDNTNPKSVAQIVKMTEDLK